MKIVSALSVRLRSLGVMGLAMLLAVVASVMPASAQSPTYTIPPTDGFASTFADVQTFAVNLVTGPGRGAIYVLLVLAAFRFVWRMVNKSTAPK